MVAAFSWTRFLVIFFVCVFTDFAASLTLSADRTEVIPGESVSLNFLFEGVSSPPDLSSLTIDGFRVMDRSTSTSLRIINGVRTDSYTVSFQILASREGSFRIGPYELRDGSQTIQSNSIDLRVTKRPTQAKKRERIFAEAELSQPDATSGEQLFYILKVYTPVRNFGFSRINFSLPEFQDLIAEEEQASQKKSQEVLDGVLFQVTEIQVPIFAVRSGLLEIPPASISYMVSTGKKGRDFFSNFFGDDFFTRGRGTKKTSYSNPLTLRIASLPQTRPKEFSGLVGEFHLEAAVDRTDLKVGENLTLTIRCTGIGSLQDWSGPKVEIPGFRVYPDGEGTLEKKRTQEGFVGGVKTFQYALVPQEAGDTRLGPFQLIFYQPKTKTFRTVSTKEFTIIVTAPENQNSLVTTSDPTPIMKKKVEILRKDILPIELDWDARRPVGPEGWSWLGLIFVVLLVTGGLENRMRRRDESLRNPVEKAYRQALALYSLEQGEGGTFSAAVSKFFLRKLRIPIREVTPQELCALLRRSGMEQEAIDRVRRLLEQEEMNRYTGKIAGLPDPKSWEGLVKEYDSLL